MRFFGIVTLAIALLQRQGRITYRVLKRGFDLDDASLEDLRRELIFRRLARDEAGEGLVWIGGVPSPVAATADAVMGLSPVLAPIYGWFTEGFDTADLQEARALLQELT